MRSLLGRVILVVVFSLSSLQICPSTSFWHAEFLLKDQLLTLCRFPCMVFVAFPLLLLIFFQLYKNVQFGWKKISKLPLKTFRCLKQFPVKVAISLFFSPILGNSQENFVSLLSVVYTFHTSSLS